MTNQSAAGPRHARAHLTRAIGALAGAGVVVAAIAAAVPASPPTVRAVTTPSVSYASTTTIATSTSTATTTTAPPPSSTTLEATSTTSLQTDTFIHTAQPWDYQLVIPDLSPMITIPTGLAPAAPDDVLNAIKAGWPLELRDTALAVADCESHLNSVAIHANPNSSTDYGLFQINGGIDGKGSTLVRLEGTPELALDVTWNAAAAYRLFLQRGWEPWSCALKLHLLLTPPAPGTYALPPFPDVPTTTIPVDTEPPPGMPDRTP